MYRLTLVNYATGDRTRLLAKRKFRRACKIAARHAAMIGYFGDVPFTVQIEDERGVLIREYYVGKRGDVTHDTFLWPLWDNVEMPARVHRGAIIGFMPA